MAESQTFISGADGNEVFQAKYIPKQKGPPASDHPSMKAYLSTYPPLGQMTTIPSLKELDLSARVFTALLEVDESRSIEPWEVSLLYSNGKQGAELASGKGDEWIESQMERIDQVNSLPTILQTAAPLGLQRLYFKTPLPPHLPTKFTVKFRSNSSHSWKLVKDHQGTQEGTIFMKTVTAQESISSSLSGYVENLNPALEIKNHRSECPGTTLWSVRVPIEGAIGKMSTMKDIEFGLPWGKDKLARLVQLQADN